MSTTTAVTARIPRLCYDCQWNAPEGDTEVIQPGHRYLKHTTFPGDPGWEEGTRPVVQFQCIACACQTDDSAYLDADACGTWCCGTTPCALPIGKGAPGHEHSCRQCVREVAR